MQGVEISSRAASKDEVFEGVCGGSKKSGSWAEYSTSKESPPTLLGVIEVIHVASRGTLVSKRKGVLAVVSAEGCLGEQSFKKRLKHTREPIAFSDDNLEGTIQPHDDALIVIAQINGIIVKRVLIDQGSGSEVMCLDLFKRLVLKSEDLSKYDTHLVGFDGRIVILEG